MLQNMKHIFLIFCLEVQKVKKKKLFWQLFHVRINRVINIIVCLFVHNDKLSHKNNNIFNSFNVYKSKNVQITFRTTDIKWNVHNQCNQPDYEVPPESNTR